MNSLQDKVAVVTGGANGIGLGTVRALLERGAKVAVFDREPILENLGVGKDRLFAVTGDVLQREAFEGFFSDVADQLGPIDILFNNVGQSARERAKPFAESTEEVWRFVIEINLISTMRACRAVAPGMLSRGHGRIINMSSNAALVGEIGLSDYAAAKMAIIGLTRALSQEFAARGVTVNVVAPGAIGTRAHKAIPSESLKKLIASTPAGFVAEPADVANLVCYLASDEARFMTGQTVSIDGGRWML
jgi:NAD(P)-dependent dehydrogenase (short-subunit alcohol dehydrogenase family)